MHRQRRRLVSTVGLSAVLACGGAAAFFSLGTPEGCGAVYHDEAFGVDVIDSPELPIINGTEVDATDTGVVRVRTLVGINSHNECTGTLLRNDWVMTAIH